jgi:hypothetical protein
MCLTLSTTIHHISLLISTPLAELLTFAGSRADTYEKQQAERRLINWATDDNGRTARQAVLHASSIFTLFRYRSSYGFHEPIAFFIATLTLFSYIHLAPVPIPKDVSDIEEPLRTIRLDKINSIEATQIWLEDDSGAIRGYLTDVGNINEPRIKKRLLQVASKSLLRLGAWSWSLGFTGILRSLENRI